MRSWTGFGYTFALFYCGRMSENKESLVINVSVEDEVLQSEEKEEERKRRGKKKKRKEKMYLEPRIFPHARNKNVRSSNLPILMNRQANLRVMTAS